MVYMNELCTCGRPLIAVRKIKFWCKSGREIDVADDDDISSSRLNSRAKG